MNEYAQYVLWALRSRPCTNRLRITIARDRDGVS